METKPECFEEYDGYKMSEKQGFESFEKYEKEYKEHLERIERIKKANGITEWKGVFKTDRLFEKID